MRIFLLYSSTRQYIMSLLNTPVHIHFFPGKASGSAVGRCCRLDGDVLWEDAVGWIWGKATTPNHHSLCPALPLRVPRLAGKVLQQLGDDGTGRQAVLLKQRA